MNDMLDTMYSANGIGLAAIQIGVPKRIIVMDLSKDENKKEPRYFVNPVIKDKDISKSTYEEGFNMKWIILKEYCLLIIYQN